MSELEKPKIPKMEQRARDAIRKNPKMYSGDVYVMSLAKFMADFARQEIERYKAKTMESTDTYDDL